MSRLETLLAAENEGSAPARTCADEVAYWLYSSGTTGTPKGVMHVHSSPMIMARQAGQDRIGLREDDVIFSAAKLFFSYGLGNAIICPMSVGATSVFYPERPTPQTVFETLRGYQPTMFYGVPTLYAAILADPECTPKNGSSRLRLCFSAGEPLPPHVGEAWKERFGLDIVNGVGSTEMGHLYLTNLPDAVEYGTAGVPVKGYDLKLVDDRGFEVGDDEIGELMVRGETAAAGYWNQREKSRRTFAGEWTRSGDKYLRRPDGVYIYCGRTDDMFKVSGIWVSPFEVEAALVAHPSVLEAAVIPAEDANGLIKPKAFVVLKDGRAGALSRALHEELKVHVKRTIGPWKYPRWIEFVDSLPKTATGKIQRFMLRSMEHSAAQYQRRRRLTGAGSRASRLAVLRRAPSALCVGSRPLGGFGGCPRTSITPTWIAAAARSCARSATPAGSRPWFRRPMADCRRSSTSAPFASRVRCLPGTTVSPISPSRCRGWAPARYRFSAPTQ